MKAKDVIRIGRKRPRPFDRGVENAYALRVPLARHLDDQDGVLRRQRDQHHDADLDIKIVVDPQRVENRHRADERQRHRLRGAMVRERSA
jgi:hypothetical protein